MKNLFDKRVRNKKIKNLSKISGIKIIENKEENNYCLENNIKYVTRNFVSNIISFKICVGVNDLEFLKEELIRNLLTSKKDINNDIDKRIKKINDLKRGDI